MSDTQAAVATENGVSSNPVEEAPIFKVFAGNLAFTTTDDELKTFFSSVQIEIINAYIVRRGAGSAGYGFVGLATADAAQKAVQVLDQQELNGRQVIVQIAKHSGQNDRQKEDKRSKGRLGRRGGKAIPGEVSEAEANGDAEDTETAESGDAAQPKKSARRGKKSDAHGVEVASTPTSPEGSRQPRGRKPRRILRHSRPSNPSHLSRPAGEPSKTTLLVANLGFRIGETGLSALFTNAGIRVISARIIRRRRGQPRKSRGYGFVDVGNEEEQVKAIAALKGKKIGSRGPIAVKIAVNNSYDESTAGLSEGE